MEYCKLGCCAKCSRFAECGGCEACEGKPFGGSCVAAEQIRAHGYDAYLAWKQELTAELCALNIPGLTPTELNLLNGCFVNLSYPLPNGETVKLLRDDRVYLGNQLECPGNDRCLGVVADDQIIVVCSYGAMGADPKLLLYKTRGSM